MTIDILNYPDPKQNRGVISIWVGREYITNCLVSRIPEAIEDLIAAHAKVERAETPVVIFYWHPDDLARVLKHAAPNSLTTIH